MSGSIVNDVIRMHSRSKFATTSERSSAVSPPVSTRYNREDHARFGSNASVQPARRCVRNAPAFNRLVARVTEQRKPGVLPTLAPEPVSDRVVVLPLFGGHLN